MILYLLSILVWVKTVTAILGVLFVIGTVAFISGDAPSHKHLAPYAAVAAFFCAILFMLTPTLDDLKESQQTINNLCSMQKKSCGQ